MNRQTFLGLLLFFTFCAHAQYSETIATDRPGQSIGAFTVGKGIFQVQTGIDSFGSKLNSTKSNGFLNNTVFRHGLTESFELSALIEYKSEDITEPGTSSSLNGWSSINIGLRYHIYTGEGWVPSVGFQVRWRIPRTGGDYESDQWAPRFIVVTSQNLSDRLSLTTNWGALWNGNDAVPRGMYTVNLAYSISDKLSGFIENYGGVEKSDGDTYINGGFGYLVSNNCLLDISAGYGSNDGIKEFFVSGGISLRTKRK